MKYRLYDNLVVFIKHNSGCGKKICPVVFSFEKLQLGIKF